MDWNSISSTSSLRGQSFSSGGEGRNARSADNLGSSSARRSGSGPLTELSSWRESLSSGRGTSSTLSNPGTRRSAVPSSDLALGAHHQAFLRGGHTEGGDSSRDSSGRNHGLLSLHGEESSARRDSSLSSFMTAELSGANTGYICAGLASEWLTRSNIGSASDRMSALQTGTAAHCRATSRQGMYVDAWRQASSRGSAAPLGEARMALLRATGFRPTSAAESFYPHDPQSFANLSRAIAQEGASCLVSLRFTNNGGHSVATTTSHGRTRLFDPDLGEYEAPSSNASALLERLIAHHSAQQGGTSGVAVQRAR